MNIALAIFRLHPAGGLERHAIRLAQALQARGHQVTVYIAVGEETTIPNVRVIQLGASGSRNHARMTAFSRRLSKAAHGRHDLVLGFQKLAGLDLLFCADWCYLDGSRPWPLRLLPRYRTLAALERACFAPDAKTGILLLSEPQRAAYAAAHGTPARRMTVLPPTLDPDHRAGSVPTADDRTRLRAERNLPADALVLLWIGLQPKVKGLDRAIAALAADPRAMLLVCGTLANRRDVAALVVKAQRQDLAERIRMLGMVASEELHALFALSDLLVHPARLDVTGGVILEAMAHGLPVVTTANCGFAPHVIAGKAGVVLPLPFEPSRLSEAIAKADAAQRAQWARNAFAYASDATLYSGIERACELIEAAGRPGSAQPTN